MKKILLAGFTTTLLLCAMQANADITVGMSNFAQIGYGIHYKCEVYSTDPEADFAAYPYGKKATCTVDDVDVGGSPECTTNPYYYPFANPCTQTHPWGSVTNGSWHFQVFAHGKGEGEEWVWLDWKEITLICYIGTCSAI